MNHPLSLLAAVLLLLAAVPKKPAEADDWRKAVTDPAAAHLARPTSVQYAWQEQDRAMFVHFGLATWQGHEYDDGSTPLSAIAPGHVDPDQWCRVAQSWGAKEIIFVAKHVGGFCWWPTETTGRCTRSIPWKHGKGDLVKDVAAACRRHGLKMGLYVYPDDPNYAGGFGAIGRSGRTADPAKQPEWNEKYRTQWREVLTRCGPDLVNEVWLDGSCVIPLGDIFQKYAPHAVVFQGEHASIRWSGNEEGRLRDPAWATLKSADLRGGVATQEQDDPNGDAWAPLEADTTLYDHFWFWSPEHERTARKSVARLADCYTQASGRGGLFLLDSSPNTDGRIPDADAAAYAALGAEIDRRYGHPVGVVEHVAGNTAEIDFGRPVTVDTSDLWEDYAHGQRIREYVVEGWADGQWQPLTQGTAVGRRKIDTFPAVTVSKLRVRVTRSVGTPLIRRLAAHSDGQRAGQSALTYRKPATASSAWSADYAASSLVDGDTATRWSAARNDKDPWVGIDLGRPRHLGRATAAEFGNDVRGFQIEVRDSDSKPWRTALTGQTIGPDWSSDFDAVTARYVRLHILSCDTPTAVPSLWDFEVFPRSDAWEQAGAWSIPAGTSGQDLGIDLSRSVLDPGQYEIRFTALNGAAFTVSRAEPWFEGVKADTRFLTQTGPHTVLLNRTQAVGVGASSALHVHITAPAGSSGVVEIRWKQDR